MLTRSLADWRSQYERMLRSYRRLLEPVPSSGDSSVAYDDHLVHFFMDCWHLKDWIKNDRVNVPQPTREAIETEVTTHGALLIAADLANGWKHLDLTRHVRVGADVTAKHVSWEIGSPSVVPRHEVTLNDGSVLILQDVARDACVAWEAILKKHSLA